MGKNRFPAPFFAGKQELPAAKLKEIVNGFLYNDDNRK